MLLLIDQGNTDTKIAVLDGRTLSLIQRIPTERGRCAASYANAIIPLVRSTNREIEACVIATVVPSEEHALRVLCRRFLECPAAVIGVELRPKLRTKLHQPDRLGADRIANALGAHRHYAGSLLIIDSGTALKFDLVAPDGTFEGGIIAPGIWSSANALLDKCALLAGINVEKPCRVVGNSTTASVGSGVYFGHFATVEGLMKRIRSSEANALTVIATGGVAPLLMEHVNGIDAVDQLLTLKGLCEIWENR